MFGRSKDVLEPTDIPREKAGWDEIGKLALTFDGYEYWGSFEKCAEIANAQLDSTLIDLRTCLFFEQRRYRHFGSEPQGEDLEYIKSIVRKIRLAIENIPEKSSEDLDS